MQKLGKERSNYHAIYHKDIRKILKILAAVHERKKFTSGREPYICAFEY